MSTSCDQLGWVNSEAAAVQLDMGAGPAGVCCGPVRWVAVLRCQSRRGYGCGEQWDGCICCHESRIRGRKLHRHGYTRYEQSLILAEIIT